MNPLLENPLWITRRHFFGKTAAGIGAAALGSLLNPGVFRGEAAEGHGSLGQVRHTKGRAKRIIYLFMAGGPSQLDLFDYKPRLKDLHKTELPASVRMGQCITGMTSGQSSLPVVNSMFKFSQHGKSGTWFSEVIPHIAGIADDIAVIKTINTEAINHDPAITYIQTGFQQPGRPCVGSWLSYGLGTENSNLPAFIVMISSGKESDQPLFARLWSAGFLPSEYQGVQFRGGSDPVLFLSNPPGVSATNRRRVLDGISKLNAKQFEEYADPEINSRIAQDRKSTRLNSSH